jgi:UDP-GlcNAc:undecaprenyl-phosphate/decaprenyl-phosphate GlcNAc-1-phosphate transferase
MENNYIIFNFFLTLIIFFCLKPISKIINIFDKPDKRKIHKNPIPAIGGIIIFFILLINLIIFNNLEKEIFLLASLFMLIGIIDDAIKISPNIRLLILSILSFVFLSYFKDFNIEFLHVENIGKINLNNYSIFFTVLSLLLFQNAMNMIDGINGLSGSIFLIIFIFIATKIGFSSFFILIIFVIIIFLIFNIMNKIFMGDAGIYFLSILSGLIIIDMSNNNLIYSEEIFLLMMLPGIDMLRLFFLRIINKKNPFNPDKLHIHHMLFNKLKSKAKTALTIIMIYGFPILLKISLDFKTLYLIITQLLFYLIIFYLIRDVTFYDKKK